MIIKNINLTIQEGPVKENQQTLNLHIRFLEREIKKVNQPEITNQSEMINCYQYTINFKQLPQLIKQFNSVLEQRIELVCRLNSICVDLVLMNKYSKKLRNLAYSAKNAVIQAICIKSKFVTVYVDFTFDYFAKKYQLQKQTPMLSILNFKFLRFVKLDNSINQSEMKELFIKPFEHLSTLFIKNIYLENKIFYLLSKANWPRLKKLAIEPPTKITDDAGIKYLQKQTQFKLINLQYLVGFNSPIVKQIIKISSLESFHVIHPKDSSCISNIFLRKVFCMQIYKSHFFKKFLHLQSLNEVQKDIFNQQYITV